MLAETETRGENEWRFLNVTFTIKELSALTGSNEVLPRNVLDIQTGNYSFKKKNARHT